MSKEVNQRELTAAKNYGAKAFAPLLVLLFLYFGSGVVYTVLGVENPFRQISRDFCLIVAILVCIAMGKGTMQEKTSAFAKHCANPGVMMMILIFVLAGSFAGICKEMGAVTSTVNLGLSLIPKRFIVSGLFLLSSLMSLAMGTSTGTMAAVAPVAIGFVEAANLNMAMVMCAVIGGSCFGDNLSVISDTTIAATQSCGCAMKDKFRMNGLIALPAAIVAVVLYAFFTGNGDISGEFSYELIKVVPYVAVLILAISGMDVVPVLAVGMILASVIGLATGSMTPQTLSSAVAGGAAGMSSIILLSIFIAGISGFAREYGGMEWLKSLFNANVKSRKGAQYTVVMLTCIIDFFIGNNGIAILTTAPLVKPLAKEFKIAPQRLASLLDIFACIIPGISPIGMIPLMALSLAPSLSPIDLLTNQFYLYALGIFALITIQFDLLKTREEKEGAEFYPELDEEEEAHAA